METQTEYKVEDIGRFYEEHYRRFFIQVSRFVSKNGGTLEHAEDVYHDALIIYYEKLMQRDFKLRISEEAYVMGIVKNLWSKRIKGELTFMELTEDANFSAEEVHIVDQKRLYNVILFAGKKCLDMLTMFYHNRSNLSQIAATVGLGSDHSVAVQKYKCLEKIRETIRKNSLCHEDFFE